MDKEVLTNILNRLEDKVDKISTGLATNTSVTGSHTKMLEDMKGVHDINARIILETRDQVKDLNNEIIKITSWKNGQTQYQIQTMEDIKNLHNRLTPIEQDFINRDNKKKDTERNWSKILWSGVEKVVLIVAGAILISWREIFNKIQ